MDWIKKHTDQFALGVISLTLLILSVLVFLKTQGFAEGFSAALTSPPHSKEIQKVDTSVIDAGLKEFTSPTDWTHKAGTGSLFVSSQLIVGPDGNLTPAIKGFLRKEIPDGTYVDVPNGWALKYGFDVLSKITLDEDPDKDGFTNFEEYMGEDRAQPKDEDEKVAPKDATNPKDKDSHPPYYTKLFLKQWIKIPFLLTFQATDGDPAKPQDMSFQINAISKGSRTEFLKLGDKVANSPFKLQKYQEKKQVNPKTGEEQDISELTILNTESNETVVLIIGRKTDSPDSYALFHYLWPDANKPQPIQVKKLKEFALQPNTQELYKLIDIKDGGAVIGIPGGDKTYNVPLLPKAPAAPPPK